MGAMAWLATVQAVEINIEPNTAVIPDNKFDTDWLHDAQFGVFMHFLPGSDDSFAQIQYFDVEKLAEQLEAIGARYFVFTIYQNSGWFNAPNSEYDKVVGWQPGERSSQRDLPMELADALAKRNIKLMLYITGQTPNQDKRAQKAFGLPEGARDQPVNVDFARKWAQVFREWSVRYGDKVSGWWVDGCYQWIHFNDEIAAIYAQALKAGNPHAIIAFNPGVKQAEWKTSDYTAGEINEPFAESVSSRFINGQQAQILTFLGNRWGHSNCRFSDAQWLDWIHKINQNGGTVTIDAHPAYNRSENRPVGTFNDEQLRQLSAIGRGVAQSRR